MRFTVLILAQGQQTRLPNLTVAKQLLRLPACDNVPIIYRTIQQVWTMLVGDAQRVAKFPPMSQVQTREDRPNELYVVPEFHYGHDVRLVTWPYVYEALVREPGFNIATSLTVLDEPGNSSLKGLSQALTRLPSWTFGDPPQRVVVLLGDVVYSWECLRAIISGPWTDETKLRAVCSSDLSRSEGEVWGLSWSRSINIYSPLRAALDKHPPFAAYQPGQLRRLIWELGQSGTTMPRIDDYTRDIDLPEHVDMLPALSRAASDDDARHGVHWNHDV